MIDRRILTIIPAIIMAVIIFSFSSQNADDSGKLSDSAGRSIVRAVNETFRLSMSENEIAKASESIQLVLRKSAHIFEFFIFTLLLFLPFQSYGTEGAKFYYIPVIIAVLYAGSDELHQFFISGRAGRVSDILVDGIGIVLAVLVVFELRKSHKIFDDRLKSDDIGNDKNRTLRQNS